MWREVKLPDEAECRAIADRLCTQAVEITKQLDVEIGKFKNLSTLEALSKLNQPPPLAVSSLTESGAALLKEWKRNSLDIEPANIDDLKASLTWFDHFYEMRSYALMEKSCKDRCAADDQAAIFLAAYFCEDRGLVPPQWLRDAGYRAFLSREQRLSGKKKPRSMSTQDKDDIDDLVTYKLIVAIRDDLKLELRRGELPIDLVSRYRVNVGKKDIKGSAIEKAIKRARDLLKEMQLGEDDAIFLVKIDVERLRSFLMKNVVT